jgi:hypothetical protein
MKKILLSILAAAILTPSIALAAWWNPFTWFQKPAPTPVPTTIVHKKPTPITKTTKPTPTATAKKIDVPKETPSLSTQKDVLPPTSEISKIPANSASSKKTITPPATTIAFSTSTGLSQNVSCSNMKEGDERDYCFAYEAIEKRDLTLCKAIPTEKIQQYCVVNIRMKTQYLSHCNPKDPFLFDSTSSLCNTPFEKSDPKKTVWKQIPLETPSDATSTLLLLVDYSVKSQPGAIGALAIFFDDQVVYFTNIKSGDPDKSEKLPIFGKNGPGTILAGTHKLTLRVDGFSSVKSEVDFSKLQLATLPR